LLAPNLLPRILHSPGSIPCPTIPKFPSLSTHNAVGIATGYGLDGRRDGVCISEKARIFFYPTRPD
jgi:hypothetical protein